MSYCYDLHAHSREVSPCGWLTIEEMIQRYKELGYQGFCLTNHFHQEFLIKTQGFSWGERADSFLMPWKKGKVLCGEDFYLGLGIELRFLSDPNDYLLYGVSEELFRKEGEEWLSMDVKAFYNRYQGRLLIIQAHPNRQDSSEPALTELLHGMEAVNTSPRHDNGNEITQKILREHPHLIATAGSDSHRTEDIGLAGIITEKRIRSDETLVRLLKDRDYLLKNKRELFTPDLKQAGVL